MKQLLLTRGLLKRALELSGVLPRGAVVASSGSADEPLLTVRYEVEEHTPGTIPGHEFETLEAARDYVLANREDGVTCPCCQRLVRVYKRKLNSGMALAFLRLCRIHTTANRPVHAREVCEPTKNRDFSQLQYWELMIELPKTEDQHGRTSGFWLPTERGLAFFRGELRVPKYRVHASGEEETIGWSPETTALREALPDGFDYDKLLEDSSSLGAP